MGFRLAVCGLGDEGGGGEAVAAASSRRLERSHGRPLLHHPGTKEPIQGGLGRRGQGRTGNHHEAITPKASQTVRTKSRTIDSK